jgi:hypothetical protein
VQLELQALKARAIKVTSARQELQVLKVTRAIKVISVLRVQLEPQALKVTRAIKVM